MTSTASNARAQAVAAALSRNPSTTSPPAHPSNPAPSSLPTSPSAAVSPSSAASYAQSVDPLRSLIVFVVGAPGSGKTTQCTTLARQYECHHIVFDDYVRQAVQYAQTKASKQRSHGAGAAAAATNGPTAASNSLVSGFQPSLSSSQVSTLVRSSTSLSSSSSKQPLPSLLRSRLLYQAMQYLSAQQPLFRFLVDGYLDSEDDWNEWAALVAKRKAEREQSTLGADGKRGSQSTSSLVIGFLPPIILRLVCSESVGQLRWRRALLLQRDQLAPSAALPSSAEVKARSMRYSLRTRPMIYRLGMVAEEVMARNKVASGAADGDAGSGEEEEDEDDDDLTAVDGMIVKRVDAEVPFEQCYGDMQQLMDEILRHTKDDDWTRIHGYDSDEDDEPTADAPAPAPASTTKTSATATVPIAAPLGTAASPAMPAPSEPEVAAAESDESPSPQAVNWEEDPDDEQEEADREEKERLERYERMLKLIEAEEAKWRLGLEREEAKERQRMEDEIRRLREKEEEVAAEPGHIATRKDDRFTTFISFTAAVSLLLTSGQTVSSGTERDVWVEVYRGFEREGRPGELRWVSVAKTARLPVSGVGTVGLTVAFPRTIVNTWRLSGNEKERPVMFRLFAVQTSTPAASTTGAAAAKLPAPQLIGESRTIISHLLVPPEEKGLTLTLRRPPAANAPPSAYLVISPAALHTLLQPRKIVPPSRLHTVMAERPIIPAVIPVTPSNVVSREQSRENSPVRTRQPGRSVPVKDQVGRQEEKERERRPHGRLQEEKERELLERGREKDKEKESSSRKRNKSVSDIKSDTKQREREEEEEMERMLREIDEQIGITTRKRAASFDARVPIPMQIGRGAAAPAPGAGAASAVAAKPAAAAAAQPAAAPTGRRSLVDEVKSSIAKLSVSTQRTPNVKPANATRKPSKKESQAERERLQLLALRRKRKREEYVSLKRRAESRERRRRELARIKRKAAVIKVSLLSVDCACMNLPVETKRQGGLFSGKSEVRYYLQVYRKRDKVKEKERERKVREKRGSVSQSEKVSDMYGPDVRNYCCQPQYRHLLKPSLFSLVYSSPLVSTTVPSFAPFLVPLDDQPLLFVVFASSCVHRPTTAAASAVGGGGPTAATSFSSMEHEGKDRIVGLSRLSVEDVVKMALIQQREWEVDVYGLVEREREREKQRESKLREMDRRRERGEAVDAQWEEEEDRMEEEHERAISEKHRVSVRLRDPANIEREREARKAKRVEKRRARGGAAAEEDSESDDSEGEETSEPVSASVPLLSFFSLAFFSTRPVDKDAQQLVEYVPKSRQSVGGVSQNGGQVGTGGQVGGTAANRASFTVKAGAPASSAVADSK